MNCKKCGYGLVEGNPVCPQCGTVNKLAGDAPEPPPGMQAQPATDAWAGTQPVPQGAPINPTPAPEEPVRPASTQPVQADAGGVPLQAGGQPLNAAASQAQPMPSAKDASPTPPPGVTGQPAADSQPAPQSVPAAQAASPAPASAPEPVPAPTPAAAQPAQPDQSIAAAAAAPAHAAPAAASPTPTHAAQPDSGASSASAQPDPAATGSAGAPPGAFVPEPVPGSAPLSPKKKKKKSVKIAIIIAIIIVVGVGGYFGINAFIEHQRSTTYDQATTLLGEGQYQQARDKFAELKDYRNATELVTECDAWLVFVRAETLTNEGKFDEATEAAKGFADVEAVQNSTKAKDWKKKNSYGIADLQAKSGQYATAYTNFKALGSYQDSAERAKACIQPTPGNVELYHHGGYVSSSTDIVFDGKSATKPYYIKVYSGDTLVSTLFVNAGGSTTIQVPPGDYSFKRATGENWFGEADMYGKSGTYRQMLFDSSKEVVHLDGNKIYTITLYAVDGGTVGNKTVDPNSF